MQSKWSNLYNIFFYHFLSGSYQCSLDSIGPVAMLGSDKCGEGVQLSEPSHPPSPQGSMERLWKCGKETHHDQSYYPIKIWKIIIIIIIEKVGREKQLPWFEFGRN